MPRNPIRTVEDGFSPPVKRDICGSEKGYRKHISTDEVPCDKCKDFMALNARLRSLRFQEVTESGDRPGLPPLTWKDAEDALRQKPVKRNQPRELLFKNPDDSRHGTPTGYSLGCRCSACYEVGSEQNKKYREQLAAELLSNPDHELHGTIAGYSAGCRCDACRETTSIYRKEYEKKIKEERGDVPKSDPVKRDECGTLTGFNMHYYRWENSCDDCRKAKNESEKAKDRAKGVRDKATIVAKCGTLGGFSKHLRLGETPCDDCKRARYEYQTARKRSKGVRDRSTLGQCGTRGGYSKHRRLGETPCDACRKAQSDWSRDYRARLLTELQKNPDDPRHGDNGYAAGCRCETCCRVASEKDKEYRKRKNKGKEKS